MGVYLSRRGAARNASRVGIDSSLIPSCQPPRQSCRRTTCPVARHAQIDLEYPRPARVVAIEAFAAVEHGGPALF